MLKVRLLGQFDARRDGVPLGIPSRAAQSLLAYLLLTAGIAHRREKLAGLFWPNTLEESARHNLRHELWRIRKAIEIGQPGDPETGYLLADEFSIAFNANAEYWLDVSVLERTRVEGASADDLMTTLSLYRGELLPGFYDEWVVLERERLHAIFEQKMARLLDCLIEEQRWQETLEWSERWIALGRTPEPAFRALMIAHSEMGDKSKVASTYQRCVESLRKDLGVEPSETTRDLFERLRVGEPRGKGAEEQIRPFSPAILRPRTPAPLPDESPAPGEPPFKGLQYFDEGDAEFFFGRELLTAKLAAHLPHDRFLAIVGASGSGKSSIVRAGLVPALKRDDAHWQYHVIAPTAHPLEALAAALTRDAESVAATATLCDDLARDPRCLRFAIKRVLQRDRAPRLALVVDQFEELFVLCHDEFEREAFIDNLLGAIAPEIDAPVSIVIALRADFYAHCAQYPDLRDALAEHQEFIGPMSAEELRRAIEEPAKRGGWEFEQGLVDLILRDVGDEPGALPLLSHALLETWKRRRGRTLTLMGYAESGGVRGAIAQTADTVFNQLTLDQQHIARSIFLRLTELGEGTQDTRRRAAIGELIARPEDAMAVQSVLNTLADARLITTGAGTAEVAHEALIREWHTLREWLNENREGLRLHHHLTESAEAWQKSNRESGELYRGARLAQALEWAKTNAGEMNPLEREFLDASKELAAREEAERETQRQRELVVARKLAEAERRRATLLRWAVTGSTILLVVMIGLALFAFSQRDVAENERRIAFARELSVNALSNLDVDPERSILLAMQAVSVSSAGGKPVLLEAEEALHRAVMISRVRMTLHGHTGYVKDATFSPDGKRIATASCEDNTAKIWDATTGKELLTLTGHTNSVHKVAFSPDGKRIATASQDKTAKIWDVATGKELMTLQDDQENYMVAFSPDGTRIATGCGNKTAKVWDAATGKLLFTLPCQAPGYHAIAFSPDGRRIATRDVELTAKVWDAETGKELLALGKSELPSMMVSIAYSPDGKRIATAAYEGLVNVWDAISGRALLSWTARPTICSVAFDRPFGTRLFTGHTDGTIKVWDISSASTQGAGSTTGQLLFTLAGHVSSIYGVEASPDGSQLVTASLDYTAKTWDITDQGTSEWLTISDGACCFAFYSPDGKRLIGTSRINALGYGCNRMNVWDATTGQILCTIDIGLGVGGDLSLDGKHFVAVTSDKMAKVWDVDTGNQLFSAPTANADDSSMVFYGAAFHPDGTRFATATGKGNITIWDLDSGKELMTLSGHTINVNALAYSPDGTLLASNADTVKIWDALSGKELRTLPTRGIDVTFSPDGTRLATVDMDGTATVWDVATGKELQTLRGHTGKLFTVAFSPDGNRLVTGGDDSTIKIWNVSPGARAGEQPLTVYGGSTAVISAQFSPDGKRIVTGYSYRGAPGSVRVFALDLDDILAIAKLRVTRALTNDECRKYLHVDNCP